MRTYSSYQLPNTCFAAVVLPDGFFFGEGTKTNLKRELLEEFSLHTIVRFPKGVFIPDAGSNTKLWQCNYWEHFICNESKMYLIREYICNNPAQWEWGLLNAGRISTDMHSIRIDRGICTGCMDGMKTQYKPPYTITSTILLLVAKISEALGRLSAQADTAKELRLRHNNRICSIQVFLATEKEAVQA
jgi:hypothetical protein